MRGDSSKYHFVTANLVGTYDLSPSGASAVSTIDYLCVYEFEYEGKTYEYRTHQRDNFSPIPETLDLCFIKDPEKAYKTNRYSRAEASKSSSGIDFGVAVWIFVIAGGALILFLAYRFVKFALEDPEMGIPSLLFYGILAAFITWISRKKVQQDKTLDKRIEEAMVSGRTATAYLVKSRSRRWSNQENRALRQHYKEYTYVGKYEYSYNGKKYRQTFEFASSPPKSIRVFFQKNPKKIFHFTLSR